jgi:lipoyl(octanoyl) transferase
MLPCRRRKTPELSTGHGYSDPVGTQETVADSSLQVQPWGLGSATIDYETAWQRQRAIHAEVAAGRIPNTVLLLEHAAVFTAGRSTEPGDRPFDGSPVVETDRGGRITWHGPGQLVAYPIVRLGDPLDVRRYVCRLEQAIIDTCADLGLQAGRVEGRTGVWVDGSRKVAAIGVRVSRGTTLHGLALNCDNDLSWYERIVPCGIRDAGVSTLSAELGRSIRVTDIAEPLAEHLRHELRSYR